jgi:hypothetical protein
MKEEIHISILNTFIDRHLRMGMHHMKLVDAIYSSDNGPNKGQYGGQPVLIGSSFVEVNWVGNIRSRDFIRVFLDTALFTKRIHCC